MKWIRRIGLLVLLLALGPVMTVACGNVKLGQDWRTADRSPAGLAPDPAQTREAVVQIYAARAFNWRGVFAVHTWIATKAENEPSFTVYHVMGWRAWRGMSVVVAGYDTPDRAWYGATPEVVTDLRGAAAQLAIPKIEQAVRDYPYPMEYTVWPGPNSNTFVAYVGRQVPEIEMDLPVTAIGKDYLGATRMVGPAPSNTGYQLSLFGLLGVTLARQEGLEVNLLGLAFGIDPLGPAIKLPGLGRIGPR